MDGARRIQLPAPIVGIRLHSPRPDAAGRPAPESTWLLSLGERERQRAAAAAALRGLIEVAQQAVRQLPQAVAARLDEVAALAVALGLAVAREVVGAALDRGAVDPTPTVARCLRDCVHGSSRADLVVRLHPADLELVRAGLAALPGADDEAAAARFVADPALGRGAVRAETETGRLRYDPREVLERIAAEVRREVSA